MMDILKLAREAWPQYSISMPVPDLQRYTDLVLEEAAKVCENYQWSLDLTQADVARAIRAMKGKP